MIIIPVSMVKQLINECEALDLRQIKKYKLDKKRHSMPHGKIIRNNNGKERANRKFAAELQKWWIDTDSRPALRK